MNWAFVAPIALLCVSNIFMTFAWYGQLKYPNTALWILIPISWGTAKQYSKNAMPQLIGISIHSAVFGYLSCPYQANVMKMLETHSSAIGATKAQFMNAPHGELNTRHRLGPQQRKESLYG